MDSFTIWGFVQIGAALIVFGIFVARTLRKLWIEMGWNEEDEPK